MKLMVDIWTTGCSGMVHMDPMDGSGGTHHLALCMTHHEDGKLGPTLRASTSGTHGVLRCILLMQDEYILSTVLTLGLLHRGTEKLMEYFT